MAHLNNCNSTTNGERDLISRLPPDLVIFDIGCRFDSDFQKYKGIVHYFDPVEEFINRLIPRPTQNTMCYYNPFGLSDKEDTILYYPMYQSFLNRTVSCRHDDSRNAIPLKIKTALQYINDNNITSIGMIKIDTEGYELNVLKGFGDKLNIVERVQFEYGGTYLDCNVKMIDVINLLREHGFTQFSYVVPRGLMPITDFSDHYHYCNIYCTRG
jgi:FkbM family methyltransferase